jgi:hypothetical protein
LAAGILAALGWNQACAGGVYAHRATWNGAFSEQADALAKGVTRTMWLNKMRKLSAGLMLLALMVVSAGAIVHRLTAAEPAPPATLLVGKLPVTGPPVAAKNQQARDRQFDVACEVFEVGKAGKSRAITKPEFQSTNDQGSTFFAGQEIPLPGKLESVDSILAGTKIRVIVTAQKDGRLRLDISMEMTAADSIQEDIVMVSGQTVRYVKLVNPGDTVQFEYGKDIAGEGRYRASFTVREVMEKDR